MKVTVVGAGNVGATCANCIAEKDIVNEVVLLDIKEGVAEGKSLDMWQTAPINLYDTRSVGAESYRLLAEEVLPVPLGPQSKYACAILFSSIALLKACTIFS